MDPADRMGTRPAMAATKPSGTVDATPVSQSAVASMSLSNLSVALSNTGAEALPGPLGGLTPSAASPTGLATLSLAVTSSGVESALNRSSFAAFKQSRAFGRGLAQIQRMKTDDGSQGSILQQQQPQPALSPTGVSSGPDSSFSLNLGSSPSPPSNTKTGGVIGMSATAKVQDATAGHSRNVSGSNSVYEGSTPSGTGEQERSAMATPLASPTATVPPPTSIPTPTSSSGALASGKAASEEPRVSKEELLGLISDRTGVESIRHSGAHCGNSEGSTTAEAETLPSKADIAAALRRIDERIHFLEEAQRIYDGHLKSYSAPTAAEAVLHDYATQLKSGLDASLLIRFRSLTSQESASQKLSSYANIFNELTDTMYKEEGVHDPLSNLPSELALLLAKELYEKGDLPNLASASRGDAPAEAGEEETSDPFYTRLAQTEPNQVLKLLQECLDKLRSGSFDTSSGSSNDTAAMADKEDFNENLKQFLESVEAAATTPATPRIPTLEELSESMQAASDSSAPTKEGRQKEQPKLETFDDTELFEILREENLACDRSSSISRDELIQALTFEMGGRRKIPANVDDVELKRMLSAKGTLEGVDPNELFYSHPSGTSTLQWLAQRIYRLKRLEEIITRKAAKQAPTVHEALEKALAAASRLKKTIRAIVEDASSLVGASAHDPSHPVPDHVSGSGLQALIAFNSDPLLARRIGAALSSSASLHLMGQSAALAATANAAAIAAQGPVTSQWYSLNSSNSAGRGKKPAAAGKIKPPMTDSAVLNATAIGAAAALNESGLLPLVSPAASMFAAAAAVSHALDPEAFEKEYSAKEVSQPNPEPQEEAKPRSGKKKSSSVSAGGSGGATTASQANLTEGEPGSDTNDSPVLASESVAGRHDSILSRLPALAPAAAARLGLDIGMGSSSVVGPVPNLATLASPLAPARAISASLTATFAPSVRAAENKTAANLMKACQNQGQLQLNTLQIQPHPHPLGKSVGTDAPAVKGVGRFFSKNAPAAVSPAVKLQVAAEIGGNLGLLRPWLKSRDTSGGDNEREDDSPIGVGPAPGCLSDRSSLWYAARGESVVETIISQNRKRLAQRANELSQLLPDYLKQRSIATPSPEAFENLSAVDLPKPPNGCVLFGDTLYEPMYHTPSSAPGVAEVVQSREQKRPIVEHILRKRRYQNIMHARRLALLHARLGRDWVYRLARLHRQRLLTDPQSYELDSSEGSHPSPSQPSGSPNEQESKPGPASKPTLSSNSNSSNDDSDSGSRPSVSARGRVRVAPMSSNAYADITASTATAQLYSTATRSPQDEQGMPQEESNLDMSEEAVLQRSLLKAAPSVTMITDPKERVARAFISNNGYIADPLAEYRARKLSNVWTLEEKIIFTKKFIKTPKNFHKIASFLPRKTTNDCVEYYYLSKQIINYKALIRASNVRRKPKSAAATTGPVALSSPILAPQLSGSSSGISNQFFSSSNAQGIALSGSTADWLEEAPAHGMGSNTVLNPKLTTIPAVPGSLAECCAATHAANSSLALHLSNTTTASPLPATSSSAVGPHAAGENAAMAIASQQLALTQQQFQQTLLHSSSMTPMFEDVLGLNGPGATTFYPVVHHVTGGSGTAASTSSTSSSISLNTLTAALANRLTQDGRSRVLAHGVLPARRCNPQRLNIPNHFPERDVLTTEARYELHVAAAQHAAREREKERDRLERRNRELRDRKEREEREKREKEKGESGDKSKTEQGGKSNSNASPSTDSGDQDSRAHEQMGDGATQSPLVEDKSDHVDSEASTSGDGDPLIGTKRGVDEMSSYTPSDMNPAAKQLKLTEDPADDFVATAEKQP